MILLTRSNVASLVRTQCKMSAILHVIIHCTFYKKLIILFGQLLHWHTNKFTYMVFFNHNDLKAGIHTNECIVQNKTFLFSTFPNSMKIWKEISTIWHILQNKRYLKILLQKRCIEKDEQRESNYNCNKYCLNWNKSVIVTIVRIWAMYLPAWLYHWPRNCWSWQDCLWISSYWARPRPRSVEILRLSPTQ